MQKHVRSRQVVIELNGSVFVAEGLARRTHLRRDQSSPFGLALDRSRATRQVGEILRGQSNRNQSRQDHKEREKHFGESRDERRTAGGIPRGGRHGTLDDKK